MHVSNALDCMRNCATPERHHASAGAAWGCADAVALKPSHEAGRRGGDSIARAINILYSLSMIIFLVNINGALP